MRTNMIRTIGAALALAVAAALAPADAQAQGAEHPWSIDARGGIAVPAGDLSDAVDVGPSFGLGIAYRIHPRIALRVDGDLDVYSGADLETAGGQVELPDLNLWHYNAGLAFEVTRPGASPWDVTANLGAGATTFDGDAPAGGGSTVDDGGLSETYFTANGGLRVGYDVHESVNVYAGGQWYLAFTDEEDTAGVAGPEAQGFDTASSIPLTLGVKIRF